MAFSSTCNCLACQQQNIQNQSAQNQSAQIVPGQTQLNSMHYNLNVHGSGGSGGSAGVSASPGYEYANYIYNQNQSSTPIKPSGMSDIQSAYDNGYEDGLKAGKEGKDERIR